MTKTVTTELSKAGFRVEEGYIYCEHQPIGTTQFANRRGVTASAIVAHYCHLHRTLYGALERLRQSIEGDRAE